MENLNKIRVGKGKNGLNMGLKNGYVEPVAIPSLSSQMQLWSVIGEEQTFHSNVTLLFPFFSKKYPTAKGIEAPRIIVSMI